MSKNVNGVRRITLQEYEKQTTGLTSSPLYVLNTTGQVKQAGKNLPAGEVVFNVQGESGHRIAVVVPMTFIPVDLTQEVHRKNLLESSEFKRCLQRGRLTIIEPESAIEYMKNSKRAQDEFQVQFGVAYEADTDIDMSTYEDAQDEALELMEENTLADNEVEFPEAEEILALLATDEDRAYSMLNNRGLDMSVGELQYVSNSCSNTRIKDLCMEIIRELDN